MASVWFPRAHSHLHSHAPAGFSSLFRMLDDFDRYTQGQLSSPTSSGALETFAPKFDVRERDKDYLLQGELPGVPPENVIIEFTDPQTLVIRGKSEREHHEGDPEIGKLVEGGEDMKKIEGTAPEEANKETTEKKGAMDKKDAAEKKGKYWLSERSFGEFSRVFSFPLTVDQDKVQAKFDHGVLNVTVPKSEKKGARRIQIE